MVLFSGTEDFQIARERLWDALHDPQILQQAIPGCKEITLSSESNYLIRLELGVAAIKGEYVGRAQIIDGEYPKKYSIKAEGEGAPGFVKIHMQCELDEVEGGAGTLLKWNCDVEVGGLIAGMGGRVLAGVAKFLAKQFFQSLRKAI